MTRLGICTTGLYWLGLYYFCMACLVMNEDGLVWYFFRLSSVCGYNISCTLKWVTFWAIGSPTITPIKWFDKQREENQNFIGQLSVESLENSENLGNSLGWVHFRVSLKRNF